MGGIVWIERGGDGTWYLRTPMADGRVGGRVEALARFQSLNNEASLAEIDAIITTWGWRRIGSLFVDEMGAYQVPVTPAAS